MLNILIIDDSTIKIERVIQVLTEGCGIPNESIDTGLTVSDGRRAVAKKCYDLVLLDLVLPILQGDEASEDGGISFIREIMSAGSSINVPIQILGLTEKADAYAREKEEFQSLLFNVIHIQQRDNEWVNQLKQTVNYLNRSKDAISRQLTPNSRYDIAIICALPEEFTQMQAAFGGQERWKSLSIDEDLPFLFKTIVVTTANNNEVHIIAAMAGRPGVIPTSVLSTIMYIKFQVNTVFMTGFSAGFLSKGLQHGDILVASSIQDYASGKLKDIDGTVKLLHEIHQVEAPTTITLKMQELIENIDTQPILMSKIKKANLMKNERDSYQISMSATCCGPFVVTSEDVVRELNEQDRKLEGLDMEGYGLYLTSKLLTSREQRGALWIKGIADFASSTKGDDYHKVCSFGSASLLYYFIKEKY